VEQIHRSAEKRTCVLSGNCQLNPPADFRQSFFLRKR
jgi:hypothetical protein